MIRIFVVIGLCILISCSNDPVSVDCSLSNLTLENVFSETVMPTDCNTPDGVIKVTAAGGGGGYQFSVNEGTFQPSSVFSNLSPGIYSFTVRDKNKCEATLTNVTLMSAGLAYTAEVTDNTTCVGGNGSIVINVLEGQPPYQYKFGDGAFESGNAFADLESGNYQITVKDNTDCIAELYINVPQGLTNTSWSAEILPIMQSSCALNGCHNGVARADLRMYSNAKFYASTIKTYTKDGYMPFEGTISQDQIDLIACWVEEGAQDN